jgi:hypothetical protein
MDERFSRQTADTIAKRAGNICSNPDCQAITTGPAETPNRSVNVGEAAHIFGANPGSARFEERMSSIERSDITNAIWLCRICHKLIDADAVRFPASLLFEWRREHENAVIQRIGKPGELARQRVLSRELEEFKGCSYLAQQIIIDKPYAWEFKLTAELLRSKMAPILARWRSLNRALYTKPAARIPLNEILDWHQSRMDELTTTIDAINGLINNEIAASWGPPGQPGSETEILRVCDLIAEACQRFLEWEESVRFASVPPDFKEVKGNLIGIGGRQMEKISVIPIEMAKIFEQERPTGMYRINVILDLPDRWAEKTIEALKAAVRTAFH